jgi:bifunctional UDP-N-acetylglucosamine pyrophosphorylase/glucosamine-1-phosphate N-acetyltransferase
LIYDGYWQPLKLPWHILDMSQLFLSKRLKPDNHAKLIASSAVVGDNVYLGKGVRVMENAVIKGPSYIGDNSIIGTGSLIINSLIEKNCVVGFITEVTRSYIGEGSWLHRNYIGDSVLESQNHFGAGAVTANFRLDEDHIHTLVLGEKTNTKRTKFGAILGRETRVGVNSSLMPGVKIGSRAIIGPGVVLYHDVNQGGRIFNQRSNKQQK